MYGLLFQHELSMEEALETLKLGQELQAVPAHRYTEGLRKVASKAVARLVGNSRANLDTDEEVAVCFKNLFTLSGVMASYEDLCNDLSTVIVGRLYGELLSIRRSPLVWVRLLHTLVRESWSFLHYSSFSDISKGGRGGTDWEGLLNLLSKELENSRDTVQPAKEKGGLVIPLVAHAHAVKKPGATKVVPQYLYARPVGPLCIRMVKILVAEKDDTGPGALPQYAVLGMLLRMAGASAQETPVRPNGGAYRESDVEEHYRKEYLTQKKNSSMAGRRCRDFVLRANGIEKSWFLLSGYTPRITSEVSYSIAYEAKLRKAEEDREAEERAIREATIGAAKAEELAKAAKKASYSILTGENRRLLRDLCAGRPVKGVTWGSTDKGEKYDAMFGTFLRRSPQDLRQLLGGRMEGRTVRVLLKYPSLYPLLLVAAPSRNAHTLSEESLQDLRQAYLNRPSTRQMVAQAATGIATLREAIDPFKQELPVGTGVTLHDIKYRQGIEGDPLGVWVLAGCPGLQAFDTGINFGTLGCASERAEDLLLFVSVLKNLRNRGIVSYSERADILFDTGGITPYSWGHLLTALETVSSRIGDSRNGICFVSDAYRDLSYSDLSVMSSKQLSTMHKGSTVLPLTHFVQKVLSLRGTKLAFESAEYLIPLLQLLGEVVRTGGSCVDPRPTVFRSVALERLGLPARVVSMMMMSGEGQTYESEPQGMRAWLQVAEDLPKIVGEARPVASFMME